VSTTAKGKCQPTRVVCVIKEADVKRSVRPTKVIILKLMLNTRPEFFLSINLNEGYTNSLYPCKDSQTSFFKINTILPIISSNIPIEYIRDISIDCVKERGSYGL